MLTECRDPAERGSASGSGVAKGAEFATILGPLVALDIEPKMEMLIMMIMMIMMIIRFLVTALRCILGPLSIICRHDG